MEEHIVDSLDPFTNEQMVALVAANRTHPDGGATEQEVKQLMAWAHHAYLGELLLEMVLDRALVVTGFAGDEPRFGPGERPQ